MHDIEIYFIGGTSSTLTEISDKVAENFVKWLDDKDNLETFKIDFPNHNKTSCIRKDLILFINVI